MPVSDAKSVSDIAFWDIGSMIIGHWPAGYLAALGARRFWPAQGLFAGILIGAVLPDIDMLWFFLVDDKAHHHHSYLTHRPALWALLLAAGLFVRVIAPEDCNGMEGPKDQKVFNDNRSHHHH